MIRITALKARPCGCVRILSRYDASGRSFCLFNRAAHPGLAFRALGNGQDRESPSETELNPTALKLDYAFSTFAHHSASDIGSIHSLSDLTETTNLINLLPQRRPYGSPADTLSILAGDDAMLVSPNLLAIADGVSGWEDKAGFSSSKTWSRAVLETLSRLLTEYTVRHLPRPLEKRDIDQILDDSVLHTSHLMDIQHLSGSSTLILAMLSGVSLRYISIGDSKLYIIRDGEIILTNQQQMKSALCPQQIGTHTLNKLPSSIALVGSVSIEENDIIFLCSDGISDNLYDFEIAHHIDEKLNLQKQSLKETSNSLLVKAKSIAFDDYAMTPYNEVVNSLPNKYSSISSIGGKLDDMSLCVAKVVSSTSCV